MSDEIGSALTAGNNAALTDQLIDRLLAGIQWRTMLFHVGQYCGPWLASTAGRGNASFHIVLRGNCFLHRPGHPPAALTAGDAVFLLRDEPHHLSPDAVTPPGSATRNMRSVAPIDEHGTSLACGFIQFAGSLSRWMIDALPTVLISRTSPCADLSHASTVFELMRAEADRNASGSPAQGDSPSPLMERLTHLLFFYVLRHHVSQDALSQGRVGLWALARRPLFANLMDQILQSPSDAWTTDRMAAAVHLSRASFFRQFVETGGEPPAQFLLRLRMQLAAQKLHSGVSISRTAEFVGYRSNSAFSRAFERVIGQHPGSFQRLPPDSLPRQELPHRAH